MSLKRKPAASDGWYNKRKKLGPLLPAVCSVGTSKVKREDAPPVAMASRSAAERRKFREQNEQASQWGNLDEEAKWAGENQVPWDLRGPLRGPQEGGPDRWKNHLLEQRKGDPISWAETYPRGDVQTGLGWVEEDDAYCSCIGKPCVACLPNSDYPERACCNLLAKNCKTPNGVINMKMQWQSRRLRKVCARCHKWWSKPNRATMSYFGMFSRSC